MRETLADALSATEVRINTAEKQIDEASDIVELAYARSGYFEAQRYAEELSTMPEWRFNLRQNVRATHEAAQAFQPREAIIATMATFACLVTALLPDTQS